MEPLEQRSLGAERGESGSPPGSPWTIGQEADGPASARKAVRASGGWSTPPARMRRRARCPAPFR